MTYSAFSFTQDDMTMEQIGIQQTFARGHSLSMKSKQTQSLAVSEQRKAQEQAITLIKNVRETWLDLYYWTEALRILHVNQSLYQKLLDVIESQYKTGRKNQSDMLQVQLEVYKLNDQAIQIQQQINVLRAQLSRWIGIKQLHRPLLLVLPHWPRPPTLYKLEKYLQKHPLLKIDAAGIRAAQYEVGYAREQYKPGWIFNLGYAKRQGDFIYGTPRPDFVGAQVTMDLPVFTANRQDRQLKAGYHRLLASKLDQQIHYRDLLQVLTTQYAIWNGLSDRVQLYKKQLIPEAKQNTKATLMAYQNATTELTTVLRAYSNEINIQLEEKRIGVERAKSRVILFYLEGATA